MASKIYEVIYSWNSCPWEGCGVDLASSSYGHFDTLEVAQEYIRADIEDREKEIDPVEERDPYEQYHIWEIDVASSLDEIKELPRRRERLVYKLLVNVGDDDDDGEDEDDESE